MEKESPSVKSIRSPSFGSSLSFTPKKMEGKKLEENKIYEIKREKSKHFREKNGNC